MCWLCCKVEGEGQRGSSLSLLVKHGACWKVSVSGGDPAPDGTMGGTLPGGWSGVN